MNRPERDNYVQANRRKIEAIKLTTTQIIDMMNPFIAVKEGDAAPLTVLQGEPVARDIFISLQDKGAEITHQDADRLAAQESATLRRRAEVAILGLQLSTSLLDLDGESMSDDLSAEHVQPPLVSYSYARYAAIEAESVQGEHVRLSHTQLNRMETGDSTELHEMMTNDGVIVQSLAIASLNNIVKNVKHSVRGAQDELIRQCVAVLGEVDVMRLVPVLSRTTNIEEIDAVLGGIWQEHKGRGMESGVAPLLNDIRSRAIAAQRAREMTQLHNIDLPSVDKLHEFGRLLGLK